MSGRTVIDSPSNVESRKGLDACRRFKEVYFYKYLGLASEAQA